MDQLSQEHSLFFFLRIFVSIEEALPLLEDHFAAHMVPAGKMRSAVCSRIRACPFSRYRRWTKMR